VSEKYKRNPNTKCTVCATPIYMRPNEQRKHPGRAFCGRICYGISCRKEKPCLVCGKPILGKFNKKTCSRSCANINRAGIKYHLGNPKSKVKSQQALKIRLLNERGKSCERCGYSKHEILQIHHKDENRSNNDLDNLELICPNCHYEGHFLENSWLKDFV
jgi:hypothetical protein